MPYEQHVQNIAPLRSFDPEVFKGNATIPQNVCDFILCLSLAYNDFRDVFFADTLLDELGFKPDDPISVGLGVRNGLHNTLVRVRTGFVHELLDLVKKSQKAIRDPAFAKIVRKLSKPGKEAWFSLLDAATNKSSSDLAKTLLFIRNKVSFHYDAKELARGYDYAFFEKPKEFPGGKPFVSLGSNLITTRFYFPDAAVQGYIRTKALTLSVHEFLLGQGDLLGAINQALYELVARFIQSRNAWRQH